MATTERPSRYKELHVVAQGADGAGHAPSVGSGGITPLKIIVPSTQSVDAFHLEAAGTSAVLFAVTKSGQVVQGGVTSFTSFVTQVAVSSAQLLAMFGAPVTLLAAPGAGIAIVVDSMLFEMKRTTTAYANGGTLQFQYHSATTVVHQGTIPASRLTTAAAASTLDLLNAASATNSLACAVNDGIDITNNSAPFITGTGTAIVTISGYYVTLG